MLVADFGLVWFCYAKLIHHETTRAQFHKDVTSANAYVVFAHPAPDRSANVRPIMNPYEAATQVIAQGNNSLFQDRHLRLDAVRPTLDGIAKIAAAEGKSTLPARREIWTAGRDVKNSLFVGNLDAAAKEEDLRLFFEALVQKERGEEPVGGRYVVDVRIIRDRETQMAKGFGYIAFNVSLAVILLRFGPPWLMIPRFRLRSTHRNEKVLTRSWLSHRPNYDTRSETFVFSRARPYRPLSEDARSRPHLQRTLRVNPSPSLGNLSEKHRLSKRLHPSFSLRSTVTLHWATRSPPSPRTNEKLSNRQTLPDLHDVRPRNNRPSSRMPWLGNETRSSLMSRVRVRS